MTAPIVAARPAETGWTWTSVVLVLALAAMSFTCLIVLLGMGQDVPTALVVITAVLGVVGVLVWPTKKGAFGRRLARALIAFLNDEQDTR
ncbi:hypothetical protein L6E12_27035 [Actinokineospora sp. PR83]|uniref:hypothetical protein n=1 Tax=Actinokineospora sp. PR83 TaxID=2884908 RepID=UPI001F19522B|nr:hypothetical protein [Actinokineospora sp. PR83]MCG8919436.1 hypothetical protein [Actinokineospora sp. PR83]